MTPTIYVTGLPRSGTTLVCHLLSSLPDVVALHEPMKIQDMAGCTTAQVLDAIDAFARENRESILTQAKASSKQISGEVPDNPIAAEKADDGLRKQLNSLGEIIVGKTLPSDFTLAIKHNAFFAFFLASLAATRSCFAIIRNPLAVLASWQTVDLPVNRGQLPAATQWDTGLAAILAGTPDVLDRQFIIMDWFFSRYAATLPAERIIRYEDVIASGGRCLAHLVPSAAALQGQLKSRNRSGLYDRAHFEKLGSRLLDGDGAYSAFYSRLEIETLLKSELESNHAAQ